MDPLLVAVILLGLVFVGSVISVELGISVAIVEIALGIAAGNAFEISPPPWIEFLAGFGGIFLTFLAGAEVDVKVMREKWRESVLIGVFSFAVPALAAFAYCYLVAGWSLRASEIAGIALSTTSLAVVYAVLVETELTNTQMGKILMAACFVTDFGVALGLSLLFAEYTIYTAVFYGASVIIIMFAPNFMPWIFRRYGERTIEPEIKFIALLLFAFMFLAKLGASHAVLPVFVLGLALSNVFREHALLQKRLRLLAFAFVTPFFFLKGGMNVSLSAVAANAALLAALFGVKFAAKTIGVYPLAKKFVPREAVFATLLMSTGLTFGTISSMYGLSAGYIDSAQFSVLVTVVVLTAVVPTVIAQWRFHPEHLLASLHAETDADVEETVEERRERSVTIHRRREPNRV